MTDTPWLDSAVALVGTKETTGKRDNPVVMQFYKDCGHPEIEHDETAWCAAFVGSCLVKAGKPLPQPLDTNLMARAYLNYGSSCKPVPGAIAVWGRGAPPLGHVGMVVEVDEAKGTIKTVEGNNSNRVKYATHKVGEALDYRWPPATGMMAVVKVATKSKTVWMQIASPFVIVLGYITDGGHWLFDTTMGFVDTLPGLGNDIEGALGTAEKFSGWLGLPFAKISLGIVAGFSLLSIARHVKDHINWGGRT